MMRVLFCNRFDCLSQIGGDTIQMLKTKEFLEKAGVHVDISRNLAEDTLNYDIVHIFNLMRPIEAMIAIRNARKNNKKIVFSSIFWDFSEFNMIGRNSSIVYKLLNLFPIFLQEKLKDTIRLKNSNIQFNEIVKNICADYKSLLKEVDLFLPNSEREGQIINEFLGFNAPYVPVYNGIDETVFNLTSEGQRKDGVFCARFDPRKNHVSLFKGYKSGKVDLYGSVGKRHAAYYRDLLKTNPGNYNFCGERKHFELSIQLNRADFHVMPSWLETPGLAQLEAAACGCKIISTDRGSAYEYFGNYATYCDPSDPFDIGAKIQVARDTEVNRIELSEYIIDNFSWSVCARQTKAAYEVALNGAI